MSDLVTPLPIDQVTNRVVAALERTFPEFRGQVHVSEDSTRFGERIYRVEAVYSEGIPLIAEDYHCARFEIRELSNGDVRVRGYDVRGVDEVRLTRELERVLTPPTEPGEGARYRRG